MFFRYSDKSFELVQLQASFCVAIPLPADRNTETYKLIYTDVYISPVGMHMY